MREYYISHLLRDASRYTQADPDYYLAFVENGYVFLVRHWILSGMRETPDYMATISQRFVSRVRIQDLLA